MQVELPGRTVAIAYAATSDGETAAVARGDEPAAAKAERASGGCGVAPAAAARACWTSASPRTRPRAARLTPEVSLSVRSSALRWLAATHRVRDGDIFTSRFYPAEQSWTGRDAWWVQLPVHRLEALGAGDVHLVCQAAPDRTEFHYLRVPAAVLRDNMEGLDLPGDGRMVSLFLSAEPATRFRDERGSAQLDLAPFVRPTP